MWWLSIVFVVFFLVVFVIDWIICMGTDPKKWKGGDKE